MLWLCRLSPLLLLSISVPKYISTFSNCFHLQAQLPLAGAYNLLLQ